MGRELGRISRLPPPVYVVRCKDLNRWLKEMPNILLCRCDETKIDQMRQTALVKHVSDSVSLCGGDKRFSCAVDWVSEALKYPSEKVVPKLRQWSA